MFKFKEEDFDWEDDNIKQFNKPTFYSEVFFWTGFSILIEVILVLIFTYLINKFFVYNPKDIDKYRLIFYGIYLPTILTRYIALVLSTRKYNGGIITWIINIILISLCISLYSFWYLDGRGWIFNIEVVNFLILCPFMILAFVYFIMSILENLFKNKLKWYFFITISSILGITLICLVNIYVIPSLSGYLGDIITCYAYQFSVFFLYFIYTTVTMAKSKEPDWSVKVNVVKKFALESWQIPYNVLILISIYLRKVMENYTNKNYECMKRDELIREIKHRDSEIKNLKNRK